MLAFTTNELFNIITSEPKWYEATDDRAEFCSANAAGVLKYRHNKGMLSQEAYDKLFIFYGFKKELLYTKNT